jgi:hypothetical protein
MTIHAKDKLTPRRRNSRVFRRTYSAYFFHAFISDGFPAALLYKFGHIIIAVIVKDDYFLVSHVVMKAQ